MFRPGKRERIAVVGAGVAGLVAALECAMRGAEVEVLERAPILGARACSWLAGGMLAPWCERESAEPAVMERGQFALDWWPRHFPDTVQRGTLVVAPPRDESEIDRFARRTQAHVAVDALGIAGLEPDLAGRFRRGLFFPREAHLDPRRALEALAGELEDLGVVFRFGVEADPQALDADTVLDCRGFAARETLPGLRGVRGEMVIVRAPGVTLSRPVRFLHPRFPLYIVPRANAHFMIGATMIESEHRGPPTVRSAMELLNAAFTLHPAFGEAEIVELDADLRPAFPDNLPRLTRQGRVLSLNGLFRHGFLLSPALAREAADLVLPRKEVRYDLDHQW
ncbi:glycine oxidase ThiO [Labrys miyagiensis]|uniref:D-amino-acid oxidase n=1 Tax=Labrys miyagiensis TaxID=346912 RepID=A0ABQ6CX72_9HYPH|nr:glycine oxidase ThiO [Labrys miyagiensis]GLS23279.1 glycine oxidase ThiO [Labrys miyagiensis]